MPNKGKGIEWKNKRLVLIQPQQTELPLKGHGLLSGHVKA